MTSLNTWIKLEMIEHAQNYSVCPETAEVRNNKTLRILKQCINGKGYKGVSLYLNGKRKTYFVHQLLWISMNGQYDTKLYQVDHINHERCDNRLDNLRLVTKSVNQINISQKRGKQYEYHQELPDSIVFDEEYDVYFSKTYDKFFRKVVTEYREVREYKDKRKNSTFIQVWKNNKQKRLTTTKFRQTLGKI